MISLLVTNGLEVTWRMAVLCWNLPEGLRNTTTGRSQDNSRCVLYYNREQIHVRSFKPWTGSWKQRLLDAQQKYYLLDRDFLYDLQIVKTWDWPSLRAQVSHLKTSTSLIWALSLPRVISLISKNKKRCSNKTLLGIIQDEGAEAVKKSPNVSVGTLTDASPPQITLWAAAGPLHSWRLRTKSTAFQPSGLRGPWYHHQISETQHWRRYSISACSGLHDIARPHVVSTVQDTLPVLDHPHALRILSKSAFHVFALSKKMDEPWCRVGRWLSRGAAVVFVADMPMQCLPQRPLRLFLTACAPSSIPNGFRLARMTYKWKSVTFNASCVALIKFRQFIGPELILVPRFRMSETLYAPSLTSHGIVIN
jgi:hypothetical protein